MPPTPQRFGLRPLLRSIATAAAVAVLAIAPSPTAAADRPNILFILADDVGQEVLGCYGGTTYRTPHLDALARGGMRFRHAYSMPVCHPTRLTLMTGRYPFRLAADAGGPIRWGDFPAAEEAATWSNRLRGAGYATAIAGKWQLGLLGDDPGQPRRLGFERSDLFGWHEGPRYYEPMVYRDGAVRDDTLGHYGPDLYLGGLIEFMRAHRDGPFVAYHSMALCHEVTDDLDPPVPHGPLGRYDSFPEMVAEMDRAVGRLVAALEALDLRERTLVLFTADNGTPPEIIIRAEGANLIKRPVISEQDGRLVPGGKKQLTDDGTNVPLIANWPGTIAPGQVVDDLVDMSDFLPTFAELAGADVPDAGRLDGHSFAGRLLRGDPSPRPWAYAEEAVLPKPGGTEPDGESSGLRWVRTARWKLYSDGRLFDMATDPQERRPVSSGDERTDDVRAKLESAFASLDAAR